jgi:hypothetical protein
MDALTLATIIVRCVNRTCTEVPDKTWTARASFNDTANTTGWGTITVSSSGAAADMDQAFAAGFAEAAITWRRTLDHHRSFMAATFANDTASRDLAVSFITDNDRYVLGKLATETDAWWTQLGLVWEQLAGLIAGHNAHAPASGQLTRLDFLLMNGVVDLSSVIHKPFASDEWTRERAADYTRRTTHCSALVKILPDYSELLTSHNTWTAYYMMLRAAKKYSLPFRGVAAADSASSGYFGTLSSTDDFYVLSSGLVVQETTNALFNDTLAHAIVPQAVLTWARGLVANRLATGGSSWAQLFVRENSGTINNQWMVVDYNRFIPFKVLPPGTLWIVEQIPEYTEAADVTDYLVDGHWPSYNRPFFKEVFSRSGHNEMVKKYGDHYTYQLYSRAKIFRRQAGSVHDRAAMRRIMRYNEWQTDPYSLGSPENAIASRADMADAGKPCCAGGNIDAKIVGKADVAAMRFEGTSGPTHDTQPVFEWSQDFASTPHYGQPHSFPFGWELLFA